MSTWSSQQGRLTQRPLASRGRPVFSLRRFNAQSAVWLGCLICVLIAEGIAVTHSYLWAAPLICLLVIAVAIDIPLVPFVGVTMLARVLTDASSASPNSRHTGSIDLSGGIAVLLILVALGLLLRRRQGVWPTTFIAFWLILWTAIAVISQGATTVTIREGVRELSILAVAVIAYNSHRRLSLSTVGRLVQLVGFIPAVIALYQFATHSGMRIGGEIRANGTFSHPNGAALFFALAVIVSLWRYLADGHRRLDAFFVGLYAVAGIATFSLGGLSSLLTMLLVFGTLQRGGFAVKFGAWTAAILIIITFVATPLGAERIATESSTTISSSETHATAKTSLAWRLYKWQTLLPEWERAPFFGQGLGTTVTSEGTSENRTNGILPHSEYVRYLVETGALGVITLFLGIGFLIRLLARRRKMTTMPNPGALGIAVIVGILVNALAANTLLYTPSAYVLALILPAALLSSTNAMDTSPSVRAA